MPEALIEFSAKRFYQGRLRTACAHAGASRPALVGAPFDWAPGSLPLLFVDTADAEPSGSFHEQRRSADTRGTAEAAAVVGEARPGGQPVYGATSYRNPCEARLAAAAVRALVAGGLKAADIGVITPYAAQVRAIGDELGGGGGWGGDVEVSSVDGFQGREKEAIVLSAVRSNANRATGFLKDWRRLNVSITRARRCIIVIGDSRTLSADPSWGAFINHARKRGGYVKIGAAPGAAERGPARATPEPDAGSGSAAAASAAAA
ncbi:AAA domain-containing protein [Pavlovales sp. CCMP2436]|nr:AAA domain-containing protein [Pavlovales sp. CCMP2436]